MGSLRLGAFVFLPPSPPRSFFSRVPCRGSSCVPLQICNYRILHYQSDKRNTGNNGSKFLDGFLPCCGKPCRMSSSTNAVSSHSEEPGSSMQTSLDAFYRFTRPHTVIGTALGIISVSLLAVEKLSDISPLFVIGLMQALISSFFMNVYIVGLNQLFDIEIDKINKPDLPLASGEYSVKTGVMIVSTSAFLSFAIGGLVGSWPLFWALFISFVLGTAYSTNLPFLRWKRSAVAAAMCILVVRAVIVQLAFFMHIQKFIYGSPTMLTRPLIFATAFMSFFSVVIALFKDIPDIVGDRTFGIRSFTVSLGQEKVFWICIYLLQIAYGVAGVVGVNSVHNWSKFVTVLGHAFLASVLWKRAKFLDLTSQSAIKSFYMFIWKLFYAEYLLIPLVR